MSYHKDTVNFGVQEANRMALLGDDEIRVRFRDRSDATLIGFWNDGDGTISWRIALEEELRSRGYTTRKEDGTQRLDIPIVGNK